MVQLEVLRYDPQVDDEPHFQHYEVPCKEEWVVLDALNAIKESIDPTLNYRWSCHMAVCGSCGMMINGEPRLSCHAFLRGFAGVIRVEPLAHFPIERDLVTVADDFIDKLKRVKPYLIPGEPRPIGAGEYLQTPAQLMKYRHFSMCINCMLCYAACPQYALQPLFLGPAAITLAHRYNLDSRDGGREQRQQVIATDEGVWECSFVGACSEVCPKAVDPAAALQQVKVASTLDWFREHLLPGSAT
ncbi:MAG: succinate dehydrogenase/fumarate reductase iron-sulfur subunit [Pseudomonadota bacterium]|nr:succinate dehydrogenase/fumarate reductase iron-sulfur subunit [Pseudomonadota bacterium]